MSETLLEVRNLKVTFRTEDGIVCAVDDISFTVNKGDVLGIVGESGSGKSVTMLSIMGLTRGRNATLDGEVMFKGVELLKLPPAGMRKVRGVQISMIFQDPMTSLNPVYPVGWQITEQIRAHEHVSMRAARRRAAGLLAAVGIPSPQDRLADYPHQFSGGMRQRVMIAMALSCNPELLIADEPTTALDVTVQAQILDLLKHLRDEFGTTVVLITHDMGVVAEMGDQVLVMYAGRIVEQASKRAAFYDPQHPYTWGLLESIPRIDRPRLGRLHSIAGSPPSLTHLPPGCRFAPRCVYRFERCKEMPALTDKLGNGHLDACHLSMQEKRRLGAKRS